MAKQPIVQLKSVVKEYALHHEKPTFAENIFRKLKAETFTAIDKIDLVIAPGEKLGLIGPNGSGKTTLLKLIAGISTPTKGTVKTRGKVVSLIDLEAGFHPDMTGEENIFLNGLVVGMSKKELQEKFAKIVAFADIGKFIDAPLYTYSEGMKLRLGFSVVAHSDPDIFILDESFAVGDEEFRNKAEQKMVELLQGNVTFILVSHWFDVLEKNCKRIVWLENGRIIEDGGLEVIEHYKHSITQ